MRHEERPGAVTATPGEGRTAIVKRAFLTDRYVLLDIGKRP